MGSPPQFSPLTTTEQASRLPPTPATNYPFLGQYAQIQQLIDFGRGLAANVVGQPGAVFRLQSGVSDDYVSPATLYFENFPLLRKVLPDGFAQSSHRGMNVQYFRMVCDLTRLKVGDVWVLTDPYYGAGANQVVYETNEYVGVALAFHSVMGSSFGVGLNRFARIYRPAPGVDPDGFANTFQQDGLGLYIVNGAAQFLPVAQQAAPPSWVPIGLQPVSGYAGDQLTPDLPGMTPRAAYFVYIPSIQGYAAMQHDYLVDRNGARMQVMVPYHLEAGMAGNSVRVELMNSPVSNAVGFPQPTNVF